jgi:hypothetical protein
MNRITMIPLFTILMLTLSCQAQNKSGPDEKQKDCKLLSRIEAEKILGRSVELVTNSWTFTADLTRFDCTYQALANDPGDERAINLYFLLEEAADETEARRIYADIWNSNRNHRGIEVLSGIGDEAYRHSDNANFHFVMARKGKFTIRLKINRTSETTSPEELKAFAKKVIGKI